MEHRSLAPRTLPVFALLTLMACQMDSTAPDTRDVSARQEVLIAETYASCAASRCSTLNLDGTGADDFRTAAILDHVTSLMASHTRFDADDLAVIAGMTQLQELHIGSTSITDLSGLRALPQLRLLHVQENNVADLSPIANLTELEELAVGWSAVGDLGFVSGLPRLARLNLEGARIDSLAGLRGKTSLRELDLSETSLPDDLSPLLSLPNLEILTVAEFSLEEDQNRIIDQLRARGVEVDVITAIIVC